ncbi:ABC transporter permease subunit [Streptomyces sparsogenes]|uniref:ABC transporter permease subunit n=1 Tax=Streptomyces sparsogenes TaxID=67365 RepID=UPI003324E707
MTATAAAHPQATEPRATEPRPRFSDLVAAEWIKLRSLRSTWLGYGATALAVLAFNVGTAYDTYRNWSQQNPEGPEGFIRSGLPLDEAFTVNAVTVMMLALGALGAMPIVGEYATGTIRTTLAAVPARRSVMAAKVVVVTAVAAVFGAFVAGVSFAATQAILGRRDAGVSLGDPGALRVVVASALLAPLCALVGLALGTVLRQTAATMIASVAVILVLPIVLTDGRHWSAVASHCTLYQAWLRLVAVDYHPLHYPWTVAGAWTVYAVWAAATAVIAVVAVHRRDQ